MIVLKSIFGKKVVTNRSTLEEKECIFVSLHLHHLEEVLQLQQKVYDFMDNKDLYVPLTKEEFHYILAGNGIVFGAYVDHELIGLMALQYPDDKDNLGREIDLTEDELKHVAHFECAFILPEYQGNKIHLELNKHLIEMAKKNQLFRHILVTIHPENYPSIYAHLSLNIYIIQLKQKYNGLWRYIFYQNIVDPYYIAPETTLEMNVNEKEKQIELFNKGYVGYKQVKKDEDVFLCLAKRKKG